MPYLYKAATCDDQHFAHLATGAALWAPTEEMADLWVAHGFARRGNELTAPNAPTTPLDVPAPAPAHAAQDPSLGFATAAVNAPTPDEALHPLVAAMTAQEAPAALTEPPTAPTEAPTAVTAEAPAEVPSDIPAEAPAPAPAPTPTPVATVAATVAATV